MAPDPVDELYGLDLEEFTAARDALAKELRAAGDKEAAAEVKRLPKPTRAAWAVNRLARERPQEVEALVQAGEALAGAQEQLLEGADAAVLRQAAAAARRLVDALADDAPVDGAAREKVRATLHAATVDPGVRAAVAQGRVVKEAAAVGFGGLEALAAAAPAAAAPRRAAGKTKPPRKRDEARARAAAAARAKAAARARDDLRRAKAAEATAQDAVAGARHALAQVEETARRRRAELEDAERALSEARGRRERAEQAAERAEAEA